MTAAGTAVPGRGGLLDLVWRRPYALLPLPPLFWAGNLVIGRAFAQELPPFGLTFWRWVVASAVLLPFVWRDLVAHRRALLAHWPVIVACAASGFAGYPVLNYLGLHSTPAATAAMLNSTLPLMVPIFAWAITREAPRRRVVAGIVLSFLGVGWIVGRGDPATLAALSVGGGEILVLLAVAGFALYSILLRWRPRGVPDMAFLAATTLAACVLMAPFWIFEEAAGRSVPFAPYAVASLLFIGIFSSLLANLFWNRCVAALGPALTGASFHLMAVYSAALAFLLLGEPVHGFHLIGIGLILLGFAIAVLPGTPSMPRSLTDCLSRLRDLFRMLSFGPAYPFHPPPPLAGGGKGEGFGAAEADGERGLGPAEILDNPTLSPVIDTPSPSPYPLPRGEGESKEGTRRQVIEF